jgi:hypothetical protein
MIKLNRNFSKICFCISILLLIIYYCYNSKSKLIQIEESEIFTFKSECSCRKNEEIHLENKAYEYKSFKISNTLSSKKNYEISVKNFKQFQFTCDYYNSFRRGQGIRTISFSLYGNSSRYSERIYHIIKKVKQDFSDWIIRIYHDNSIDPSTKCKYECLVNENGDVYDNIDFCNIESIPVKNSLVKTSNFSYVHGMAWRWLPIGDSFIDIFSSRDTDSIIIQREVDSVNFWLNSPKPGHIMRGI